MLILPALTHSEADDLTQKKIIGKGSFGTVYGPISYRHIQEFLEKRRIEYHLDPTIKKYIIKIERPIIPPLKKCMRIQDYQLFLNQLDPKIKRHFIYSKMCGIIDKHHLFDIQEYGGDELFSVIEPSETKIHSKYDWTNFSTLKKIISSFLLIMKGCFQLIDLNVLLTDIKLENMVFNTKKGVSLIDLEFYPLEDANIFTHNKAVITKSPHYMPIQLFALLPGDMYPHDLKKFSNDSILKIKETQKMNKECFLNVLRKEKTKKFSPELTKTIAKYYIVYVFVSCIAIIIQVNYYPAKYNKIRTEFFEILKYVKSTRLDIDFDHVLKLLQRFRLRLILKQYLHKKK